MDKNQILEILNDWNFWKKDIGTGIERKNYLALSQRFLQPNVILALMGVRRSGKSYIMRQIAQSLIEKGVQKEEILMVNFEDRRLPELSLELLDQIYETYLEFLAPKNKPYIFLDEIQKMPRWEKWARTIQELGQAKIIISGSSAKLLSGELATVLTGRHLDLCVFPLDFREFLYFKNKEIKDALDILTQKIELKSRYREYSEYGGFPEVILSAEKKQLLLTYYDDIITKDIEQRYNLRKSDKLRSLARFYLTNISNSITFNSLKKSLGLAADTIEKFTSYLEEANLIFFIRRFSYKVKEQETAARKVYAIDSGLANALGFRFSENTGHIAENIVALELRRKQRHNQLWEIYYWQNIRQEEVDFVIKERTKVTQLIQVCSHPEEILTKNREIRTLLKAMEEFGLNEGLVITEDYETEEKFKEKKIKYLPLWKWLLGNSGE